MSLILFLEEFMPKCKDCSFNAKNKAGLTAHARKHAREKKPGIAAVNKTKASTQRTPAVCRSCHALPIGSVELVSLLLVLIFALTAVLFTSVYALQVQQNHISELEAQI
jgi:hypothetical protein